MRICVIGGANADITATTFKPFKPKDSNPGTIRLVPGGVARNIAHNLALLGDEVVFLTLFGGDTFGYFTADSCRKVKIDITLSDAAPVGTRSCFLSINDADGEMVGGVSDMLAADGITPEWLATKLPKVGPVDAYVADTNIPIVSLTYLIDHVDAPLFVDAVSSAKAPRVIEAMRQSTQKKIHSLKCNWMENQLLAEIQGVGRRYVSLGDQGIDVVEGETKYHFDALPCEAVNTTGAGDALVAGLVHAGPEASVEEAARVGLRCAQITCESPDTVNNQLKQRYEELS
ncbi:MAG: hypothetical protein J5831_03600 [Bacteroidales bacterium]|nr:hypothetical protein [Bacteroidales bacterium]